MSEPLHSAPWLHHWIAYVQRRAIWVVAVLLTVGAGAAWYASGHLSVDTDTAHMLSAELPWRKAGAEMDELFPQQKHSLVVVIDGNTPERAAQVQSQLVGWLRAEPQQFDSVFATETEPYFRREGLLFLDLPALRALADKLTQAQPFLGTLNHDPSLHGLFTLLQRAETQGASGGAEVAQQLAPAMQKIADGIAATAAGQPYSLSWQSLIGGGDPGDQGNRRFIEVNPHLDFAQMLPAAAPIGAIRKLIAAHQLDPAHGVRVRLTGSVALEHEELLSAAAGAGVAFAIGIALVIVLLFVALRSARLVIAALITLVYGLLCTAALAAWMVGHLNLISIAFGVLYIGLGIDYALYLCMQYRERITEQPADAPNAPLALRLAAADVGGFMAVCAATTSLGFLAFVPTDFTGIAELGLISGAGMFVSLVVSLSLLPALMSLLPPNPRRMRLQPADRGLLGRVLSWPYTHARLLWGIAILAALASLALLPKAHFDYDPLHLRDPNSESVSTFRDLLKDPNIPALSLDALAPNEADAKALSEKLSALPLVARVMSADSFVPEDQSQKLAVLDDLNFTLGPELMLGPTTETQPDDNADLQAFDALRSALPASGGSASEQALKRAIDSFHQRYDAAAPAAREQLLTRLRGALLGTLPAQLEQLSEALQAQPVTLADLPSALRERWIAPDGRWRLQVWPRERLDNNVAMQRFVDQVRDADPHATGAPIEWLESGRAVVHAFRQAFAYSVIAITLLLLILMRSLKDTLLVLIPLVLAGLLTVGIAVAAGLSFNFANVIALPLILGVGVDYGVYIVQRGRAAAGRNINLLQTGTARAVLFGALITVANFGNLALSQHPGTRSMGLLLTIGLGTTMLCALVLLPSLLARRHGAGPKAGGST